MNPEQARRTETFTIGRCSLQAALHDLFGPGRIPQREIRPRQHGEQGVGTVGFRVALVTESRDAIESGTGVAVHEVLFRQCGIRSTHGVGVSGRLGQGDTLGQVLRRLLISPLTQIQPSDTEERIC